MTVLDTLNFVAFNPLQNNNPIAARRRKLIAKLDEQIQLAANKDYTPTQHKWVTDEHGNQRKVEVAKRHLCKRNDVRKRETDTQL